jgi:hypothetical protein
MIKARNLQAGLTFISLLVILILICLAAMVAFKVAPSVIENHGINSAIEHSVQEGHSVIEIRNLFDRTAETGYIDSITGKDLNIDKDASGKFVVTYEYIKKIPLFGPVSLVIDYSGGSAGS